MILAIETATAVCGVALVENGRVILERSIEMPQMHAEKLALMIGSSLAERQLRVSGLAAIAVSIGPGSFTGLRIGLSTAKGLAFASSIPLVTVPTLRALALNAAGSLPQDTFILPLIDARRDELYGALYQGQELAELVPPSAFSVKDAEKVVSRRHPLAVLGDGAEKFVHYREISGVPPDDHVILVDPEKRKCSASSVGILGERLLREGSQADLASVEPLYVKEFFTTFNPHSQKDHS